MSKCIYFYLHLAWWLVDLGFIYICLPCLVSLTFNVLSYVLWVGRNNKQFSCKRTCKFTVFACIYSMYNYVVEACSPMPSHVLNRIFSGTKMNRYEGMYLIRRQWVVVEQQTEQDNFLPTITAKKPQLGNCYICTYLCVYDLNLFLSISSQT